MADQKFEGVEFELLPKPTFVPLYERENYREDGTGVLDHTTVIRDGKEQEVTNFDVMQTAYRDCVPPRKMHYGAAWSVEARKTNELLRAQHANGEITSGDVFQRFVVGVYMQDLTVD